MIIAVTNQKGGVAKTTTVVNLAAGLALEGYATLVVDADPQTSTTHVLSDPADGVEVEKDQTLYTVMMNFAPLQNVVRSSNTPHRPFIDVRFTAWIQGRLPRSPPAAPLNMCVATYIFAGGRCPRQASADTGWRISRWSSWPATFERGSLPSGRRGGRITFGGLEDCVRLKYACQTTDHVHRIKQKRHKRSLPKPEVA